MTAADAFHAIHATDTPLAAIMLDAGYADQAHMTRGIRRLTGTTPAAWGRLPVAPASRR